MSTYFFSYTLSGVIKLRVLNMHCIYILYPMDVIIYKMNTLITSYETKIKRRKQYKFSLTTYASPVVQNEIFVVLNNTVT